MRRLWCSLAAGVAGCVVAPLDPFPAAQRAAQAGDLLRAIAYLDQVPLAHWRHTQARELAVIVESRINDSQRCIVEGLQWRARGDELAATTALARARELWPSVIGVSELLASGLDSSAQPSPAPSVPPGPEVDLSVPGSQQTADVAQLPLEPPPVSSTPASTPPVSPRVPGPPAVLAESTPPIDLWRMEADPVATQPVSMDPGLAQLSSRPLGFERGETPAERDATVATPDMSALRALIQGRDQARAAAQLAAAHTDHPENLEIRVMLASLLRKRALVAYGRGWLEAAVEDWERIVDLTPDDHVPQNELGTARAELARRLRTEATKKNAGG